MQTFARHRAWLAAPQAQLDVSPDLVLVTFYPALADADIDLGGLSVGFHGDPGDRLLTTLAVTGWPGPGADALVARQLAGPVVAAAVDELVTRGGERTVGLTVGDGEELLARWSAFLIETGL